MNFECLNLLAVRTCEYRHFKIPYAIQDDKCPILHAPINRNQQNKCIINREIKKLIRYFFILNTILHNTFKGVGNMVTYTPTY